jgi:protein-S-isoprenylcysteine O-methyltransferase Ste14
MSVENVDANVGPAFRKRRRALLFAAAGVALWLVAGSAWVGDPMSASSFSLGLVLVAVGFGFRVWVSTYQAGHKNKDLITQGPYSLCRNPMYLSNVVGGLGAALATETITIPVMFVVICALHYRRVIANEEANLLRIHGAAYAAYKAATPRLTPSLKGFSQPDEYLVRMRSLAAKIPLAVFPMLAVAAIVFVAALHADGLLPVLLTVY